MGYAPTKSIKVVNAASALGTDVSEGGMIFNSDNERLYVLLAVADSSDTLTTLIAAFKVREFLSGGKFIDGTDPLDAVYVQGNVGIGTFLPNHPHTVLNSDSYTGGQHILSSVSDIHTSNGNGVGGVGIGYIANGSIATAGFVRAYGQLPLHLGTKDLVDSLIIHDAGDLVATNMTIALINAEGTGRVMLTREWFEANALFLEGYNETGTQAGDNLAITIGDTSGIRLEMDETAETVEWIIPNTKYFTVKSKENPTNYVNIFANREANDLQGPIESNWFESGIHIVSPDANGSATPEAILGFTDDGNFTLESGQEVRIYAKNIISLRTWDGAAFQGEISISGDDIFLNKFGTGVIDSNMSIAEIDDGNDKTLVTREWAEQSVIGGSPTQLGTGAVTAIDYEITSDGTNVTLVEANTDDAGLLGADKWDEIVVNTLKIISDDIYNEATWNNNLDAASKNSVRDKIESLGFGTPTILETGNRTLTTYGITSDGGVDDVVLLQATTLLAGLLSAAKFDEIVANTLKETNVDTNLSEGTVTETTVDVNSSDGDNATLLQASTIRAGVMTKAKWDEVEVNNLKISDINHNVSTNLSHSKSPTNVTLISSDGNNTTVPLAGANAGWLSAAKHAEIVVNTLKIISDDVYNEATWNDNLDAASKNSVRDKIESLGFGNPTTLETGNRTDETYGITSDGSVDDIILLEATTLLAGVLTSGKFDEIVVNTLKVGITPQQAADILVNNDKISDINHNVSTNLSEGSVTTSTVDVNSSDGANATLLEASTTRAGVMTKYKWDEIEVNNLKIGVTVEQENVIESVFDDKDPVLGGDLDLGGKGLKETLQCGESIVVGKLCCMGADGKMYIADNGVESKIKGMTAIALENGNDDDNKLFFLYGKIARTGTAGTMLLVGTVGNYITTPNMAASEWNKTVGQQITSTTMFFNPSMDYIKNKA